MSEGEDLITEGMVKKATYLIHKLADRRGQDFKDIQKRCKDKFRYTNLAKVTLSEGHALIDKLIELTGGEETEEERAVPQGPQLPTKPDERSAFDVTQEEEEDIEVEIGKLAEMLRICVRNSTEITTIELGRENITEGTRAMLVKSFAATLFIEASKRGIGK